MNRSKIEWTDRELGFLEGLIDADGSISLIKEKRPHFKAKFTYKPRLNIGNICLDLLEKARQIIGAGALNEHKTHPSKPFYILDVSSNGIRDVFPHLKLIVKEKQRVLILESCGILARHTARGNPRTDEELARLEEIYLAIRKANGSVWNK